MKFLLIIYSLIFYIGINSCSAQHLMRTLDDAPKIKANQQMLIGKPLKYLLSQIKPQIKMVSADPNAYPEHVDIGYFIFNFVNPKQGDSVRLKGKIPLSIVVYVKGPFQWDRKNITPDKKFVWSKEDEEKYGDLIMQGFRVYGE